MSAALALIKPVAVAVHLQDMDVMGKLVEQCTGEPLRNRTPLVHSLDGRFEVTARRWSRPHIAG